jgi:hypothetical protein
MEDAALPSSEQRSPDDRRTIPERPRKTPIPPTSSPRISTLRLVGQEFNRLKGDEPVSSLNRKLEDPNESVALDKMDDASEQIDKLPVLARHDDSSTFSHGGERITPSRFLDGNPSVQLSNNPDDDDESELSPSPGAESLIQLVYESTNVLKSQETPPTGTFLSSHSVNGDLHPERIFGEDAEQVQRIDPGTTMQQHLRSSTNFPAFTHASRPNDIDMGDTWLIPVVQGNTKRRSLFKLVWDWLKGS